MPEQMGEEQRLVLRRRELIKMALAVAERNERGTGMAPGPQAERLFDELLTVWGTVADDVVALHAWDCKVLAENPQTKAAPVDPAFEGVTMPAALVTVDLLAMIKVFDEVPPKNHGELARHFLGRAQSEGAQGEVLEWLRIVADRDLVDGIITISWAEGESLPPPGEIIQIPNPLSPGDQMVAHVVGFGKEAGTIRIREADEPERLDFLEEQAKHTQGEAMWDDIAPAVMKVNDRGALEVDDEVLAENVTTIPSVPPPDPANSGSAHAGPKTSYGGS